MRRHGSLSGLAQPLVEHAGQLELGHALVLLHHRRHLEQPVRGPHVPLQRRVAASHHDALGGLGQDLEVVGDFRPDFVGAGAQLVAAPELVRRGGVVLVFLCEVGSLVGVSCSRILNVSKTFLAIIQFLQFFRFPVLI